MALSLLLNGIDASTYGVYLSGALPETAYGTAAATIPMLARGGRARAVRSRAVTYEARDLALPIAASLNTLTLADREAAESWLRGLLGTDVTIQLSDGVTTDREIVGTLLRVTFVPKETPTNPTSAGLLVFKCAEAHWRRRVASVVALGTGRTAIPLGTAPVEDWTLDLMSSAGSVTDLTVTWRDQAGATIATATLTGTLTTSQHAEIDAALGTVRRESAGTWTTLSTWTGGLPALDPVQAPTIALSAASGTPTGVLRYVRRDA